MLASLLPPSHSRREVTACLLLGDIGESMLVELLRLPEICQAVTSLQLLHQTAASLDRSSDNNSAEPLDALVNPGHCCVCPLLLHSLENRVNLLFFVAEERVEPPSINNSGPSRSRCH